MPKIHVRFLEGQPLLNIAAYARLGPGVRDRLSPAQLEYISRTVRRVPEVVVKVLPKDSNNFRAVGKHLGYIGRYGDLELETDDGEHLKGRHIGRQLIEDWDLDLDRHRPQAPLSAAQGRQPPKLVHKLMLSMPPGAPPRGVLAATRNFLREEFALKHRYAFVLHTDEPHPHVHVVVKAVSEQGTRLNIKKATLREWRRDFARRLREQGIAANATERAVRGQSRQSKSDGIYRAMQRGESTHMRERAKAVARELAREGLAPEEGSDRMRNTRAEVTRGWAAVADGLERDGHPELVNLVRQFVDRMPPPRTEKQWIADTIDRVRERDQSAR